MEKENKTFGPIEELITSVFDYIKSTASWLVMPTINAYEDAMLANPTPMIDIVNRWLLENNWHVADKDGNVVIVQGLMKGEKKEALPSLNWLQKIIAWVKGLFGL